MLSITQEVRNFNHQSGTPSTAILSQLDLVEYEAEYRWARFEQLTLDAQRELELYDMAVSQRRELAQMISAALAEAEAVLR